MNRTAAALLLPLAMACTFLTSCRMPFTSSCPGGSDGWTMVNPPTPPGPTSDTDVGRIFMRYGIPGDPRPGTFDGNAYIFGTNYGDSKHCFVRFEASTNGHAQQFEAHPQGSVDMLGYRWIVTSITYSPERLTLIRSNALPSASPATSSASATP